MDNFARSFKNGWTRQEVWGVVFEGTIAEAREARKRWLATEETRTFMLLNTSASLMKGSPHITEGKEVVGFATTLVAAELSASTKLETIIDEIIAARKPEEVKDAN